MLRLSRSFARLSMIAVVVTALACERTAPVILVAPATHAATRSFAPTPPVVDSAMGALSAYAQYVVAGLRDSAARMAVWRALKAPTTPREGLDLQACGTHPAVDALFAASERQGHGQAQSICVALKGMRGAILYMDAERLKQWDGTSIPLVTAIADPNGHMPSQLTAYRSTRRTVVIASDGSTLGPVLVVLPYKHPSRRISNKAEERIGGIALPTQASAGSVAPRLPASAGVP